jgi:hypothetical protein
MTMYESVMASRAAAAAPGRPGSETPVFDKLLTEYRDGFRTVPGEAWVPHPTPRFAELGGSGDRFSLPPGGPSGF